MKQTITAILLIYLSVLSQAQYETRTNTKGTGYYVNPIFADDYPDPGTLRDL